MWTPLIVIGAALAADAELVGWVLDGATPIVGAAVSADGGAADVSTEGGGFRLVVTPGAHVLTVTAPDGRTASFSAVLEPDRRVEAVLPLPAPPDGPRVRISGTVTDADGLGIPGAFVAARGGVTQCDIDGRFHLSVLGGAVSAGAGATPASPTPADVELIVLKTGFVPTVLRVAAIDGVRADATLALVSRGDELTVQAAAPSPGGTVTLLQERRDAAEVLDVVGSEAMTRAGDTDAAAALRRVNGLTLIGGKYVYVRGLGDRYSQTLLNGSSLPSPEPEKRVVPLDLFPSTLIDAVVIQKTFSPDIPAEFGGGVVEVRTRSIPESPMFSASLTGGFTSGATFTRANTLASGPTDALGFGAAWRALPSSVAAASATEPIKPESLFSDGGYEPEELEALGEAFPNRWATVARSLPPDAGVNVSAGRAFTLGSVELGAQAGLVFSNAWDVDTGWQRTYAQASEGLEVVRQADYVEATNAVRLGVIGTLAARWSEDAHVTSTTLLNRNSAGTAVVYEVDDPSGSNDARNTLLSWQEQQLLFEQVHAAIPIGPVRVDTRYAFTAASHVEPDRREFNYLATDGGYVLAQRGSWNDIYYTRLEETGHDLRVDLRYTLPGTLDRALAVGGKVFARDRASNVRRFNYEFFGSEGIDLSAPIDDVISPDNIGAEGEDDPGYLQIEENTTSADDYDAAQRIYAGYVLGDLAVTPRLRALVGARLEAGLQRVSTYEMFAVDAAPVVGGQAALHVLPAVTLSYAVADEAAPDAMVVRLGYGRTVSRPELRELSEVPYYDYRSGRLFYGNPALVDATIDHADLRWEWYPADGESVSAALFYKSFADPIESVVAVSAVSGSVGTFANAPAASNVGGEVDVRKRLDFVHPALHDLYLSGNVAVIWSEVDLRGTDGNQTSDRRPLQGQSPYVANAQLGYDNPDSHTNVALLYNVSGPRILEVGTGGVPDTYELPVHRVDLVVGQGIGPRWQVRVRAQNLLDWPVRRQVGDTVSANMREGWRAIIGITYTDSAG